MADTILHADGLYHVYESKAEDKSRNIHIENCAAILEIKLPINSCGVILSFLFKEYFWYKFARLRVT